MAQDITHNCGYWLYLGENDVPKTEGTIKPIATGSDSGSYDLSGRPVLDFDAEPLTRDEYASGSKSIPRILTRAEKGQALTHLEMDFNLASLLHKVNTSSVASQFDPSEDAAASEPEDPAKVPYVKVPAYKVRRKASASVIADPPTVGMFQGGCWGPEEDYCVNEGSDYVSNQLIPEIYGPYLIPEEATVELPYYDRVINGETASVEDHNLVYTPNNHPELTASLYGGANDYVEYDVYVPLQRDPVDGLYKLLDLKEEFPVAYLKTTTVDDEGLTHIQFTSFNSSSVEYGINGKGDKGYGTDIYFDRHKPTRDEERNGLIATFSYAPVKTGDDNKTIIQNGFQTVKVQHTTNELRYRLANERVPGTLDVEEDFHVSGSTFTFLDSHVSGSSHVAYNLNVSGSTYLKEDVEILSGSMVVRQGDLDVKNGSAHVSASLFVSGSTKVENDIEGNTLIIHGTGSIFEQGFRADGHSFFYNPNRQHPSYITPLDRSLTALEIDGDLYVHGTIFGNIASSGYNVRGNDGVANYALPYERLGTQDTGSQSDARLKLNRQPIYDAISKLSCMTGYEFDWASEAEKEGRDVGVVAQEVQSVYPFAVGEGKDGYLRVDYAKLVPLLIEAVKSLSQEVKWLRSQIQQ